MIIRILQRQSSPSLLTMLKSCEAFLFLWVYGNKDSVYKNIFHTPRVSAVTQNKMYGDNRSYSKDSRIGKGKRQT